MRACGWKRRLFVSWQGPTKLVERLEPHRPARVRGSWSPFRMPESMAQGRWKTTRMVEVYTRAEEAGRAAKWLA